METALRTYGTLTYKKGSWIVDCEPHVRMKFRRYFAGVKRQTGKLVVSDTLENCRDLLWFAERYPLEISNLDHLTRRSDEHRDLQEHINTLYSGVDYIPPAFQLAIPPREYQAIAADLCLRARGLLVADDVGLGKTVTSIAMLADPRTLPAVVVTLTHLPRQWKDEIHRFAPALSVHIAKKGTPYSLSSGPLFNDFPDVLILNYHKLAGWATELAGRVKTIIFDEVQELRHSDSQKYEAAETVAARAEFRMGLSATPIYNYGGEMYSVLNVLRPHELGTREEFNATWCDSWSQKPKIKDPKAFGMYSRENALMIRRTRADVRRELPDLSKIVHRIDADLAALDRVGDAAAELARTILAHGEERKGQKMQASEELNNLIRQATGIAKAPFVADFVRLLVEAGESVVLFGWHREVYSIWLDRLADLKPAMYTGSESPLQKETARHRFRSGDTKVLIMSLRSGAGLDGLQTMCRTAVFGELDWSPGVHEQCAGRIHRDGQQEPVAAYFLVSEFGADPIMVDVLGLKRQQIEGLRNPDAAGLERLEVDGGKIRKLAEAVLRDRGATAEEEVA